MSSVACFFLLLFLLRHVNLEGTGGTAILILAFCTPIFFYSMTFWEHSLATALLLIALVLILQSETAQSKAHFLIFGGMLIGLSTIFREEGYILFLALIIGYSRSFGGPKSCIFLTIGWLLVMLPVWIFQQWVFHHFLGLHAAVYATELNGLSVQSVLQVCVEKLSNYYVFLFKITSFTGMNIVLALPFVSALAVGLSPTFSKAYSDVKIGILIAACLSGLVSAALVVTNTQPIYDTLNSQSVFLTAPFTVFWLINLRESLVREKGKVRLLSITVIGYIAGTCLLLNQKDMGIIWGPRHFVTIFPALVLLSLLGFYQMTDSAGTRTRKKIILTAFISVLLAGLVIQIHGVRVLYLKKSGTLKIMESIADQDTEFVVTDVYWLPEEMARLYFKKKFLMVTSDRKASALIRLFRRSNIGKFTWVTSKYYGRTSDKILAEITQMADGVTDIHLKGLDFMTVQVFLCRMEPESSL